VQLAVSTGSVRMRTELMVLRDQMAPWRHERPGWALDAALAQFPRKASDGTPDEIITAAELAKRLAAVNGWQGRACGLSEPTCRASRTAQEASSARTTRRRPRPVDVAN
jgi:hypothetical protein